MFAEAEQKDELPAWDAMKTIKQGFCGHHSKPRQSKLLKDDETATTLNLETGKVFCDYFTKVFNNVRLTDDSVLDSIAQRETFENLGATRTIMEVRNATKKMANMKASGENKVPLEGYKYLSDDNSSHLYDVVVEFWTGNNAPQEFHEAKLCIIEKKGDLRLPKNYRPICLLDVASKGISVLIVDRCQSVLKLHGLDEQNGF